MFAVVFGILSVGLNTKKVFFRAAASCNPEVIVLKRQIFELYY